MSATTDWYAWIADRIKAHGGVLVYSEASPDMGRVPWWMTPATTALRFHDHGSNTRLENWNLACAWEMGEVGPKEIGTMKTKVLDLALAIESGQSRPTAVESITVTGIEYQPQEGGYMITVGIETIVSEG